MKDVISFLLRKSVYAVIVIVALAIYFLFAVQYNKTIFEFTSMNYFLGMQKFALSMEACIVTPIVLVGISIVVIGFVKGK